MSHRNPDWRGVLARFDAAAAAQPPSVLAAELLSARGHPEEAVAAFRDLLETRPADRRLLRAFVLHLARAGRSAECEEVRRQILELEVSELGIGPGDAESVGGFLRASEDGSAAPRAAPRAYVARIFDGYAERFDLHLEATLRYEAPALLFEAVAASDGAARGDGASPWSVLDLGCGTGLTGTRFRHLARRLVGVDLSPGMIRKTAEKGLYDELAVSDITDYLRGCRERFDLVLAADVLGYVGDLEPLLSASPPVLAPGGRFAFTIEEAAGGAPDGYVLCATRRYRHDPGYVRRAALNAGLAVSCARHAVLRHEGGLPVAGVVFVLEHATASRGRGAGAGGPA